MKQKLASQRPVVEMRDVPPVDKPTMPPTEFVKAWIGMFGSFTDGKIEKSKLMLPADLTPRDAKYLIDNGITIKQIANQYSMTDNEITDAMNRFGLIKSAPKGKATLPDAADEVWFVENTALNTMKYNQDPALRISKTTITINSALRREAGEIQYVQFGVTADNQIKMKITQSGLHVKTAGKKSNTLRVSCAPMMRLLIKRGVKIPAVFKMVLDESSGYWIGVLSDNEYNKT